MALLTLRDIGKIYVSEGNVAVGIRGVNLSFDKGEFVAITGRSGSGKSTLLNVISGMDTYEEGELLIEGQSTSHYLQPEWEAYREKYISFIFQDYNIIESYTVLQNVELALMHIEDARERRRRAIELLTRVGMKEHLHHKGSKLSGGQKQRTVIARALAKDSPIILADEPTGNLDHATAMEIIALLREVSRDKLLIVVTHSFEEVEGCATRHVRIFDGAVESDQRLAPTAAPETEPEKVAAKPSASRKKPRKPWRKTVSNGLTLGFSMFTSRPKLSFFLCFLLILGTLGVFLVTALFGGEINELFTEKTMFTDIEGRLVVARRDGTAMTEEELEELCRDTGAESCLHYDYLLDEGSTYKWFDEAELSVSFRYTYGKDYGTPDLGRYPTADGEAFLYLPISLKPVFGEDTLKTDKITFNQLIYTVVGVSYFCDNNKDAEILLTRDSFRTATTLYYLSNRGKVTCTVAYLITDKDGGQSVETVSCSIKPSLTVGEGKFYLAGFSEVKEGYAKKGCSVAISAVSYQSSFSVWHLGFSTSGSYSGTIDPSKLSDRAPTDVDTDSDYYYYYDYDYDYVNWYDGSGDVLYVDAAIYREIGEETLAGTYRQGSLFFGSDREAALAAETLNENGYVAVPSYTTYDPDPMETILGVMESVFYAFLWLAAVFFLAFFVNLCSDRTLSAFKGDLAIMRSMGIPVKVIRVGMYVRTLVALIPAYGATAALAVLIYTNPGFNANFTYLYGWQYAVIVVGMLLLCARVTRRQLKRLFNESVKKVLKGGANV